MYVCNFQWILYVCVGACMCSKSDEESLLYCHVVLHCTVESIVQYKVGTYMQAPIAHTAVNHVIAVLEGRVVYMCSTYVCML